MRGSEFYEVYSKDPSNLINLSFQIRSAKRIYDSLDYLARPAERICDSLDYPVLMILTAKSPRVKRGKGPCVPLRFSGFKKYKDSLRTANY